ncbi:MAG: addiction module antitoxin [Chloroflexota bacterium]|nr:addiction module antitoxin [Chloroflexota bacterium]
MRKKPTITIDEEVYQGLYDVLGRRRISRFIEKLVRPYMIVQNLEAAYREMAEDEEREADKLEWVEAAIGNTSDETWI